MDKRLETGSALIFLIAFVGSVLIGLSDASVDELNLIGFTDRISAALATAE